MTAPCAIEYILVTRWRGGKKGGQNRVCACDTRDRGVNKKLKPEHPSETVVMPESGERKRNLTTLVLVKNAAVKRRCGWDGSWLPDSSQPSLAAHGSSPPAGARKTTPRLSHSMHR